MDFSKNFKAVWWAILVITIGFYFAGRIGALQSGDPSWFDALAFTVWVVLWMGPFFKEMEILGLKFKQEIEQLKEHVSGEIASVRAAIQVTSDQKQTFNPTVTFGYPPPADSQLDAIRQEIQAAIRQVSGVAVSGQQGFGLGTVSPLDPNTTYLFSARLSIEKELRFIFESAFPAQQISALSVEPMPRNRRHESVGRMTDYLVKNEIVSYELAKAIREVYAVCSLAAHGEEVSAPKINFVRETAPGLIEALKSISRRYA